MCVPSKSKRASEQRYSPLQPLFLVRSECKHPPAPLRLDRQSQKAEMQMEQPVLWDALMSCVTRAPEQPAGGRKELPALHSAPRRLSPPLSPLCPSPECRPSRYGPDCSLGCQCDPSSSYCNARNGRCRCLNGHMGPTCREGNVRAQRVPRWDSPDASAPAAGDAAGPLLRLPWVGLGGSTIS